MRVRIIMILISLFATVKSQADIWHGESDTSWYDANSREFEINTAAQFKGLADLVNNEGVTFEECAVYLMSDIDLNNILWYPIGYGNTNWGGTEFKGEFIGGNHTIQGMSIECSELPYISGGTGIGLFGNCSGDIRDVQLSGFININNDYYYNSSAIYIGGLCGNSKGKILSCNCSISINVGETNSFMSIGTVAGKTISIQNVKAQGNIDSTTSIQAGIGGLCHRAEEVAQCSVDVDMNLLLMSSSNMTTIGGIVGQATRITNSIYNGSLKLSGYGQLRDWRIGGITGSSVEINNTIFAPSSVNIAVTYNPSWMYDNFVGPICPPLSSDCIVQNCYYSENLNTNPKNGYAVSMDYLRSGVVLDGFSSDIWLFKDGSLPSLRSLMATYVIQSSVNNGYVGVEVKEGDSLNYVVIPDRGWKVYRFYINDQDYTDSLIQDRYRFENIDRNYQIKVIFEKDEDNAVQGIGVNKPNKISIQNDIVTVSDVNVGQVITIVSQEGIVESRIVADSPNIAFELSKGIHIINIEGQSFKIMN